MRRSDAPYRVFRPRNRAAKDDENSKHNQIIACDPAIIQYLNSISNLPKNEGYPPENSLYRTTTAFREFLRFLNREPTNHAVTDLITEVKEAHRHDNLDMEKMVAIFSNLEKISVHRHYANRLKTVFKANNVQLLVSINTHLEPKRSEPDEETLRAIFSHLSDEQKAIMELQAYSGETVACLSSKITLDQIDLFNKDYAIIHIKGLQTRARYSHPSIVPRRVAEKVIEIACLTERKTTFPNHASIWKEITRFATERYKVKLTSPFLSKRFHHLAQKTDMPIEDWNLLMGVGHSPKRQLDPLSSDYKVLLVQEYDQYLAGRLSLKKS